MKSGARKKTQSATTRRKARGKNAKASVKAAAGKAAAKKTARRAKPPGKTAKARKGTGTMPRRVSAVTVAPPLAEQALHWTEQLSDGTHVIIRPIRKSDAPLEREFISRLSPEARRMRFLGQIGAPSDELIRRMTDLDYTRDMAFVAIVHRDGKKQEIGVSRYSMSADGKFCECAVTVSDEWRHRGLATLLMRHLIDVAKARGVRTMVSFDAVENLEMRQLAGALGFERQPDPDDRMMVIHRLAL